jgi:hypothetical protein
MVWTTIFIVFASMAVALIIMGLRLGEEHTAVDAEVVALEWVGNGEAHDTRRDGGRWEIDVVRPDGSMVQVNLGDDLELRGLDEELGPAGTLAPDELRGESRERAVRAAFREIGPGQIVSVERDRNRDIDVRIRTEDGLIEVELDGRFRVLEVEDQDPRDE